MESFSKEQRLDDHMQQQKLSQPTMKFLMNLTLLRTTLAPTSITPYHGHTLMELPKQRDVGQGSFYSYLSNTTTKYNWDWERELIIMQN